MKSPIDLGHLRERHQVYMQERMQVEISDPQYLWWDWIFTEKFEATLTRYDRLLTTNVNLDENGCLNTGEIPRLRIKFQGKTVIAYRFTYAVATVLPLSSNQVIRHWCNNEFCINPLHLKSGDPRQNFEDYIAVRAYGTPWHLIPKGSTL